MSILLLILGLAVGAACALAFARPNRQRVRDELKSISADVLAQTGDSLAQRLADQRQIEQERASGEMATRAREFRGLVEPVQEKLGRMESEISRLERERRQAHGELAQMVRTLGALRRAARGARSSCAMPSRWPGCSRTATSSSSARSARTAARCARTCSCACPVAS
jgi:hypothetical protein